MSTSLLQTETVATSKLLPAAAVGAGIAAVGNLMVFWVLPSLLGASPIQVQMGPPGPDAALADLNAVMVIVASVLPAFIAAGVLALLGRFTARPFTVFRVIGVVVLLMSFAPFTLMPMPTGTIITLAVMHIIAAVAIVGALDRRARA